MVWKVAEAIGGRETPVQESDGQAEGDVSDHREVCV